MKEMDEQLAKRVSEYKEVKSEIKAQEQRSTGMQFQLNTAQLELRNYKTALNTATEKKDQGGFDTVEGITLAREKLKRAKSNYENQCEVVQDIEVVIENATSRIPDLQRQLNSKKAVIFKTLAEAKAKEIEKVAGKLFEEFNAIASLANGGHAPFSGGCIPGNLEFITSKGSDLRKLSDEISSQVLK